MPKGPIRRAQLVAPFGVGAMLVVEDGTSLITAGLDHWFELESAVADYQSVDEREFIVKEWRLQRLLRVDHFRLPPDFRHWRPGREAPNCGLTVPFLRFPQWHFCPGCRRLEKLPLTVRPKVRCSECGAKGRQRHLLQVPLIAMCDHGHLQDLPWREWVHEDATPDCGAALRLMATGGATLASQVVQCDCGKKRSLAHITDASPDGATTFLSYHLDTPAHPFPCQGKRPWLGTEEGESCDRPLRGSLRTASNVYFADVRSAIYLPAAVPGAPADLVELLETPPISDLIELLVGLGHNIRAQDLRKQHAALLQPYSDDELSAAARVVLLQSGPDAGDEETPSAEYAAHLRRPEYDCLLAPREDAQLVVSAADMAAFGSVVSDHFSNVMLAKKLKETRAFAGFSRVFPENDLGLEERKSTLRRSPLHDRRSWLPAYTVYGEGIFLVVDERKLRCWESDPRVKARVAHLVTRYQHLQAVRRLEDKPLGPRFVLLHTLAHLLMNQLTFECGYSTAALKERLYVSEEELTPMAGILIYTAAGDAEGTLGGLVAMGSAGRLEPVLRRALDRARWCSADPVCMEMGARGQGPDSCNLAACHNCALVPETACEEFNRFLDRGTVIGTTDEPIGFFAPTG